MPVEISGISDIRIHFFDSIFGDDEGFMCVASKKANQPNSSFTQKFFKYPEELSKAETYIINISNTRDVYFCVNLLEKAERTKANCKHTNLVWADLDDIDLDTIPAAPQILVETSPGRYQAIWRLSMKVEPFQAETYSKQIAYSIGADKSGWDLTQLLRVPFTRNFKYQSRPIVNLIRSLTTEMPPLHLESFAPKVPITDGDKVIKDEPLPPEDALPSIEEVLYKYRSSTLASLMTQEPGERDWSTLLWKVIHQSMELGMTNEEVLVVCRNSKCDKYDRDNRPLTDLWRDILKARSQTDELSQIIATFKPLIMPELVASPSSSTPHLINQYRDWGEEATDAVPQFHDLAGFVLVSAIVANSVRLETSYGTMVPNLWGLLLGDSTLTRKTTVMRMMTDILGIVDRDCIVATEGSSEGLLTALEQRPNKVSLFLKDEVSGFFDSINRKDYLAGLPETLTALYDVPEVFTRRLRKEVIRLESPSFIFFGGGVKDKVYDVITENYVLSGFLPRFLVVTGEADLQKLRRTGPNTSVGMQKRAVIVSRIADLYEAYAMPIAQSILGNVVTLPPRVTAELTGDAWDYYGSLEEKMVNIGVGSAIPSLALPTFERLSRSLLKMALCLAAVRQTPQDSRIIVEEGDIIDAAWYVQQWGWYSIELISNAGKGFQEKLLDRVLEAIKRFPGIPRSKLMQYYHLDKKNADTILGTLEERMLVRRESAGRGYRYWIAS